MKGQKKMNQYETEYLDLHKTFNKNKLKNLMHKIAGRNISISFDKSMNCFASNTNHINIGTALAYRPDIKKDEFMLNLYGLCSHEAAHIKYTNYDIIAKINSSKIAAQKNVELYAAKWTECTEEDEKKDIEKEIKKNVYDYLFNIFLFEMHNSYEDAFIEDAVAKDIRNPFILPGILSLRNQLTPAEDKGIEDDINNTDVMTKPSIKRINHIITDLRHFATVGYRNFPAYYQVVSELFPNDLDEMLNLGIYAKICAASTEDTFAAAKVAMKWLDEDIAAVADEYYDQYMEALSKQDDADFDSLFSDDIKQSENDMSISSQKAGSSGSSRQSPPINLNLPSKLKNEIEKQKQQNSASSNSQGNSQSQDSSDSNSSDNNSSDSSSSADSNNSNNPDNSSNNTSSQSSEESSNNPQENENKNTSSHDGEEQNDSNKSEDDNSSNGQGENSEDESNKSDTQNNQNSLSSDNEKSESSKTIEDVLKENSNAASENDIKKAINELKKIEKGNADKNMDKSIMGGSGKAPSLSQSLGNIDSISDMHKGIKVNYHSPESFGKKRQSQFDFVDLSEHLKLARRFSNKLKHVLISTTKDKRISLLTHGKIDKKNLRRIVTDEKIFYKKFEGDKHTSRICILVDESGSMSGEKCIDAYVAANMLVEACHKIRVPVAVFGHNCVHYNTQAVELYHYLDYKNSKRLINNLKHISANGCNHDSIPIFQCLTDMVRQKSEKETCIFIVISDGAPAGIKSYYGEPAEKDIQNIISFFDKKYGIKTIGVGIGYDVERIPYIYKNNVIVSDTSKLPTELLEILKKEVLKKK